MARPEKERTSVASPASSGLTEFGSVEEEKKAPSGWLRWLWSSSTTEETASPPAPTKIDRPVLASFPMRPDSPPEIERPPSPMPVREGASRTMEEPPPSPLQARTSRIGTSTSASVVNRSKEYWMPDEACETCYDCGAPFSTFRRKHHCRVCGQIFCWECSDHAVPGEAYGYEKPVRACNFCYKLYLRQPAGTGARPLVRSAARATPAPSSLLTGPEVASVSPTPLATLVSNVSPKGAADVETLISRNYQSIRLASRVRPSGQSSGALGLGEDEEEPEDEPSGPKKSERETSPSSPFRHNFGDSSPPPVATIPSTAAPPASLTRSTMLPTLFPQSEPVTRATTPTPHGANSNSTPALSQITAPPTSSAGPSSSNSVTSMASGPTSTTGSGASSNNASPANPPASVRRRKAGASAQALAPTLPPSTITCSDEECTSARLRLSQSTEAHLNRLLQQQLNEHGLSPQWLQVLLPLARRAVNSVDLRLRNGDDAMDVRRYIKIKRLPGGSTEECTVVNGIVFTKNVAHKQMIRKLHRPRTLLLSCSLEYQRQENRLSSFDSLLQQELKYLEILVSKIASVSPDLVLVERTVSRLALDFLLAENISVVLNIKHALMPKLSRYTGGEILPSTDKIALSTPNVIGNGIRFFHIETFRVADQNTLKSLLFLEAEDASLGATVLLRGADLATLTKVKRVLRTALYAAHNLRSERSFLYDLHLGVSPPPFPARVLSASPYVSFNLADATPHFPLLDRTDDVLCPLEASLGRRVSSSEIFNREEVTLTESGKSGGPPINESVIGSFEAHQQILYTYGVWSRNSSAMCTIHEPVVLEYYSDNDMPLGRFLNAFCWDLDWECPIKECGGGSSDHVRSFFHNKCRLNIAVDDSYRGGLPRTPHVWTRCRVCALSTPALPLSTDTWNYSFGKFLEEVFYNEAAGCRHNLLACPHNLLRQQEIFFSLGDCVAHLWSEYVEVQQLVVPPLVLSLIPTARSALLESEIEQLTNIATRMYGVIMHKLAWNLHVGVREDNPDEIERWISSLSQYHKQETQLFFSLLDEVRLLGSKASLLDINRLKRKLCANAVTWNASFAELDYKVSHSLRPTERERDRSPGKEKLLNSGPSSSSSSTLTPFDLTLYRTTRLSPVPNPSPANPPRMNLSDDGPVSRSNSKSPTPSPVAPPAHASTSMPAMASVVAAAGAQHGSHKELTISSTTDESPEESPSSSSHSSTSALPYTSSMQAQVPSTPPPSASVATSVAPASTALSTSPGSAASSQGSKKSLHNHTASVGSTVAANTPPTLAAMSQAQGHGSTRRLRDVMRGKFGALLSDSSPEVMLTGGVTTDLMHHNEPLLPPAFLQSAQSLLHLPPGTEDQSVTVAEDEPSSVIAYCLLTSSYREQLQRYVDFIAVQRSASTGVSQSVLLWPEKTHIEVRESATNEGKVLASTASLYRVHIECTVFYAAQFSALRQYVCGLRTSARQGASISAALAELGTDMSFIESMARCKSWDARGGKSGSRFSKTLDERYVVKQISKVELAGFLEFAPLYFGYVCTAYTDVPTAFAKILGVYAVTFKTTTASIRHFFVILENVFYNRSVSQIYDLKGSLRNRFAQADPQEESPVPTVLMDENLLATIFQQPLCLSEMGKSNLAHTIRNDSAFLSSLSDYSLLVGIDSNTRELVVGIIDYMRKYTWDKHVESRVKSSGIMGGSGKDPTIISPKQYAARFREAMMQYFIMMPDKFMLYHAEKGKTEEATPGGP